MTRSMTSTTMSVENEISDAFDKMKVTMMKLLLDWLKTIVERVNEISKA